MRPASAGALRRCGVPQIEHEHEHEYEHEHEHEHERTPTFLLSLASSLPSCGSSGARANADPSSSDLGGLGGLGD